MRFCKAMHGGMPFWAGILKGSDRGPAVLCEVARLLCDARYPIVAGRAFTMQDDARPKTNTLSSTKPLPGNTSGRDPIGQRFGLVDEVEPTTPTLK